MINFITIGYASNTEWKRTALNINICFWVTGIFVFTKTNKQCYNKMDLFGFTYKYSKVWKNITYKRLLERKIGTFNSLRTADAFGKSIRNIR